MTALRNGQPWTAAEGTTAQAAQRRAPNREAQLDASTHAHSGARAHARDLPHALWLHACRAGAAWMDARARHGCAARRRARAPVSLVW